MASAGQTFIENMTVARNRFDWASRVEEAWRSASLELHRTREGDFLAFDPSIGMEGRWRPVFGRMRAPATLQDIRKHVERRLVAPIVFDGIGLGSQLDVYYKATLDTLLDASPLLYVAESSFLAVAASMHLHDWRRLLEDKRVIWCLGDTVHEQFESALVSKPHAPPPQNIIVAPIWREDMPSQVSNILGSFKEKAARAVNDSRRNAESRYHDRNAPWWARRYRSALAGKGPALRVMAITSRFTTVLQYSTRDAMDALKAIGCDTRTLIEADAQSAVSSTEAMSTFAEFEPDLVLMIDHTRQTQSMNLIAHVPLVTWVQDRLAWLFDEQAGRNMGPLDFCIGQSADELIRMFNYPADRFMSCDMATHAESLAPQASRPDPAEYSCDVAYATHASEPPSEFHRVMRERAADSEAKRLIDAIYDCMNGRAARCELNGALYLNVLVDQCMESIAASYNVEERARFVAEFARPLSDRLLRHQTIEWAANWARQRGARLHLYGIGWDSHPSYSQFARGPLKHGWALGAAFRSAKVNLHAGCNPALHQRVLDGLAAGGFFLIRKHGADVSHRVARAIYDYLRSNKLEPPVAIRVDDLPMGLREEYRMLRRFNGCDANEPFVQTPQHFENYERLFEKKTVQLAGQVWPELDRIVFQGESDFSALMDHFVAHADERREITDSMRCEVLKNYSYESLMRRMLEWMTCQLEQQAVHADSASRAVVQHPASRGQLTRVG